ncbi:hypothetical protein [Methanofollis fontis]|uniref:hypothetical protein n=1 Tax=Methanofollis fontis TaxID=2052832 RepID=UPI0013EEBA23|nr:hypothetical protein [Methanofollis fontis]
MYRQRGVIILGSLLQLDEMEKMMVLIIALIAVTSGVIGMALPGAFPGIFP